MEGGRDGPVVAGGQACVDLVVPAPGEAPAGAAVAVEDAAADLVGGGGFPAARLEVEGADFAGGVVADFHGAVVVDGRVAGDDADDGGGHLFPGVEFFGGGIWSSGPEAQEPGAERVNVKGLAVEFGFNGRFTLNEV